MKTILGRKMRKSFMLYFLKLQSWSRERTKLDIKPGKYEQDNKLDYLNM